MSVKDMVNEIVHKIYELNQILLFNYKTKKNKCIYNNYLK